MLPAGSLRVIEETAQDAWRDLDAKIRPFVARRVGASADVDDVVQDVLFRIQRGVSGLRDDQRFGPWVYQVARSAIADHLRTRMRHPLASTEPPEVDSSGVRDEGESEAERELALYVVPFIAALPSPYREALTLTELEGLTQREAAEMIGISLSGMKSRVQRGREQLRRSLEECCHIATDARGHIIAYERRPDGKLPDGCCG